MVRIKEKEDDRSILYDRLNRKVFLLKLTPGISPVLLPEIFKNYDAIIIESFGVGGIPESLEDVLFAELKKYKPEEKVLVMTTQVTYEGSHMETYEVGKKLSNSFSILEARDMTLEAVVTKLMWVLADEDLDWPGICGKFYDSVAVDTLY